MEPFVVGLLNVFARVSVTANSKWAAGDQSGREGDLGPDVWGLLACVAGVIIGGAAWAVSSRGGITTTPREGRPAS